MDIRARATSALRARPWLATWAVLCVVLGCWAVGTPLFAGPDEPAHVVHAAGIVRGQWTGRSVPGAPDYQRSVDVPERLAQGGAVGCFAFRRNQNAACFDYSGPGTDAPVTTSAGRHPPAWYALVGVPSLLSTGVGGLYLMRLVGAALAAALLASAAVSVRALARGRLGRLGLVLAFTPMVAFVGGIVNPSTGEIAAATATWTTGLLLVDQARRGEVDRAVVRRGAIALVVFVLARGLSFMWLAVVAGVLLAWAGWRPLARLARARTVRCWLVPVVAAAAFQAAWILVVRPLDVSSDSGLDVETSQAWRLAFGKTALASMREMIGVFGWLDTPSPAFTFVVFTVAVGALLVLAFTDAGRRDAVALGLLVVAVVLVPAALEATQVTKSGLVWQGRYTLPIAVGLPILAALVADRGRVGAVVSSSRFVPIVAGLSVVGHVLAYWQHLRRNAVGYDGRLWFFTGSGWHAPVPFLVLAVLHLAAITAWTLLVLTARTAGEPSDQAPTSDAIGLASSTLPSTPG